MVKRFPFIIRTIVFLACIYTNYAAASAFQVWNQDAVGTGNAQAGRASDISNASTGFYNPAGLVGIKNQQLIVGAAPLFTDLQFSGTAAVNTLLDSNPQALSAQGGNYGFIPFVHYAAPINDQFVFGLSFTEPFSLNTNYGENTNLRYATRLNEFNVYDLTPSLAVVLNDHISIGAGWDIERIVDDFDQSVTGLGQTQDTLINNSGHGWGFGYHAGLLYQFSKDTRIGLNYASQVVHHLEGSSKLIGPLAGSVDAVQYTNNFEAKIVLPPTTTLSGFHTINSSWDVLGSINYTQWTVTNNLVLQNLMGIQNGSVATNLQSLLAHGYRNTWNTSVGANYHLNDQWLFRTGIGFDQSPTDGHYQSAQVPDADRIALALGGHFQVTKTIAIDLGWTHYFVMNSRINNLSQSVGSQTVITNGSVQQNTDVYGLQLKWDML